MADESKKIVYHPTKFSGVEFYLKKNGDKSYRVKYYDSILRKQITKTIGSDSEGVKPRDCYDYIVKSRDSGNKAKKDEITLDEAANKNYDYKQSQNSRNSWYRNIYKKHISPHLGNKRIRDITQFDLADLKNIKSNETYGTNNTKYSPKMINDILMEVRVIINFAIEHNLFTGKNVAIDFIKKQKNKINNTRTRYLERHEIVKLLDTVLNDRQLGMTPIK